MFNQYCEQWHKEPNAVRCLIEYREDGMELETILKLDCECDERIDDYIFFYCKHLSELLDLIGKESLSEDFFVKDVYEFLTLN